MCMRECVSGIVLLLLSCSVAALKTSDWLTNLRWSIIGKCCTSVVAGKGNQLWHFFNFFCGWNFSFLPRKFVVGAFIVCAAPLEPNLPCKYLSVCRYVCMRKFAPSCALSLSCNLLFAVVIAVEIWVNNHISIYKLYMCLCITTNYLHTYVFMRLT